MARPSRRGLVYFPLDVDIDEDPAVRFIEAKHGPTGFYVLVKLFMRIYRGEGYYITWDMRELYLFARQVNVQPETVSSILTDCITEGLFSEAIFSKYGVLTSRGVQRRYRASTRRLSLKIDSRYYLLGETQEDEPEESENIVPDVVAYLNEKAGTAYRAASTRTQTLVRARVSEGYTLDDFKTVIEIKSEEWRGTKGK